MKKWISVKDRLPEIDDNIWWVLATYRRVGGHGFTRVLCRVKDDYPGVDYWMDEEFRVIPDNNVTHWMPLPEPPEENE